MRGLIISTDNSKKQARPELKRYSTTYMDEKLVLTEKERALALAIYELYIKVSDRDDMEMIRSHPAGLIQVGSPMEINISDEARNAVITRYDNDLITRHMFVEAERETLLE